MTERFLGPAKTGNHVITVVVGDEGSLLRRQLLLALEEELAIDVVGEAVDGPQVLARVDQLDPKLVVLGFHLGAEGAPRLLDEMRAQRPGLRAVVLYGDEDEPELIRALCYGATALLARSEARERIVDVVYAAAAGRPVLPPSAAAAVLEEDVTLGADHPSATLSLSPEEQTLLRALAAGERLEEAAERLGMAPAEAAALLSAALGRLSDPGVDRDAEQTPSSRA